MDAYKRQRYRNQTFQATLSLKALIFRAKEIYIANSDHFSTLAVAYLGNSVNR